LTSRAVVATPGVGRWLEPLLAQLPPLEIVDAHAHLGADMPDRIAARAVVFSPRVANGDYRRNNDAVIAAARTSAGRLVPFCRLNPHTAAAAEGRRAIAAGGRGIKLHPRSECFTLAHPAVEEIFALAHEHRLPVLIHAGRGIEPLGLDALRLAAEYPNATLILAHAAIADLARLQPALDACPNVLIDTAWWNPVDLLALFTLAPPGRIVFGSDAPFGEPALNALLTLRCALEAGLERAHLQSVMGGQLDRVLAGEPIADLGPALGSERLRRDPLLDRVTTYLAATWGAALTSGDPAEPLALARTALRVDGSHPHHEICRAALQALDTPTDGLGGVASVAIAACLIATPGIPATGARGGLPAGRPTSSWLL
jgi:predicted TIM-barrel fold metal-dependent hydrolase